MKHMTCVIVALAALAGGLLTADAMAQQQQQQQGLSGQRMGRQKQQGQKQQAAQQAHRRLTGQITDLRTANVQGQDHLLAKVRTRQGQTVIVDLGQPNQVRRDLNLKKGETISVMGTSGRINSKPVLVANRVADFTTIQHQRTDQQQRQRRQQRQQQQQQGQ